MVAEKVVLNNFRGFVGDHQVSLHPHLTVLVGLNGAGKSSVLDAMAVNLSGAVSLLAGANTAWFGGDRSNIAAGAERAWWATWFRHSDGVEGLAQYATRVQAPAIGKEEPKFPHLEALRAAVGDPNSTLPFLGYQHSSSTRTPDTRSVPKGVQLSGRLEAFAGAFDSESVQFGALEQWFEREENLENQTKIELDNLKAQLPSLKALRKAVRVFLEELQAVKLGKLRVVRAHEKGQLAPATGQLVIEKGNDELFIRQLSDGERRLVLLVADTARRMVILNPGLADPLLSPGILLIDEIELHLHPQWQRRVIRALHAAFPKLQLIVSTHAPAVLSTVPNECVVVLDHGAVLPGTPRVFGLDANTILNGLMGTSTLPEDVQKKVDEIYRLIDADPPAARAAIDALAAEVGADHPDLVRARGLLVFLAG